MYLLLISGNKISKIGCQFSTIIKIWGFMAIFSLNVPFVCRTFLRNGKQITDNGNTDKQYNPRKNVNEVFHVVRI